MAKEIQCVATAGTTVYAQILRVTNGQIWNTSGTPAFENYNTANIGDYDIALTQQGTASGIYMGDFPTAITVGTYLAICYNRAGGSPAEGDTKIGVGTIHWDGSAVIDVASVYTRIGAPAGASIAADLVTIDDFLDTEIAAIKAKTDNLPSDPADASDIASSFTTVNTKLDTIDDFLDTEIAAIKTKTDFLPSATAGASGGLLISGTNSGTTTLGALTVTGATTLTGGMVIDSLYVSNGTIFANGTTNGSGMQILGNGVGSGLYLQGGVSGNAFSVNGDTAFSGSFGIYGNAFVTGTTTLTGAVSLGSTLSVAGATTLTGALLVSGGTTLAATATGVGLTITGGATSGKAVSITNTSGDVITVTAVGGNGHAIILNGQGSGDGLHSEGGATGQGVYLKGGLSSGYGLLVHNSSMIAARSASNQAALQLSGDGVGAGLVLVGGATGDGLRSMSGGTSGHGIYALSQVSGDGIYAVGAGTTGNGMRLARGGASGDDLAFVNSDVLVNANVTKWIGTNTIISDTGYPVVTVQDIVDYDTGNPHQMLIGLDGIVAADINEINGTTDFVGNLNNSLEEGFLLHSTAVQSIWDAATVNLTSGGTIGKYLVDNAWNSAWDAEVQSEVADALAVYDPPTNAEMEARTLVAANYATASALDTIDNLLDTEIAAILEDTGATIPAQISALNNLSATEVWAAGTRTLTSGGGGGASAEEIWTFSDRKITSVDNITIEPGLNMKQSLAVITAVLAGTLEEDGSDTIVIKSAGGSTTRVEATVNAKGERLAVDLTLP